LFGSLYDPVVADDPSLLRLGKEGHEVPRRVATELPGADLVDAGLADLERGVESVEALLVSIGAPRLRRLGFEIRSPLPSLRATCHGRSGRRALAVQRPHPAARQLRARGCVRELADRRRIDSLLQALGREADADGAAYLTGEATAVSSAGAPPLSTSTSSSSRRATASSALSLG
jgi:hypothetical protein